MRLRTAVVGDLPALRDLYRRSSLSNVGEVEVLLAHPRWLDLPEHHVRAGRTRVAVDHDGTIAGFATLVGDGPARELEDLFVDPERHRGGVGTLLVADAVALARRDGAERIEVTGNRHALAFYQRVGFVGAGEVRTELGTGIRMRLELTSGGQGR